MSVTVVDTVRISTVNMNMWLKTEQESDMISKKNERDFFMKICVLSHIIVQSESCQIVLGEIYKHWMEVFGTCGFL